MNRIVQSTQRVVASVLRLHSRQEEISDILSHADPNQSLEDRLAWIEKLARWIRSAHIHVKTQQIDPEHLPTVRVRFIFHLLTRNPEWKVRVSGVLGRTLAEISTTNLFCQTGILQEKGFVAEAIERGVGQFIPSPPQNEEAADLFVHIFTRNRDADWIERLTPETVDAIYQLIVEQKGVTLAKVSTRWKRSLSEALLILGAQACAQGLSPDIRTRLPGLHLEENPFFRLQQLMNSLVGYDGTELSEAQQKSLHNIEKALEDCRIALNHVFGHLERSGVSVNLVYRLERIQSCLRRIDMLAALLGGEASPPHSRLIARFVSSLVRESLLNRGLKNLFTTNLHLISRKIVERTGLSGEHYITRDRQDYFQMLRAAARGGYITVGTTCLKFVISRWKAPLFFDGLFVSLNYASSFVLIQLTGGVLATKTSSMTASTLAGSLQRLRSQGGVRKFVEEVVCLTRSQVGAALGNVLTAAPAAAAADGIHFLLTGTHILTAKEAHYVMHSLDPVHSLTLPLAAFTGVLLWLSSIVAGWTENWFVYHQIPEAIAHHKWLIRVFGRPRTKRIADWWTHNIAGLGGNISLGFFLGFSAIIGKFFGVPLDVRHVTLSSAAFSLSTCSLFATHLDAVEVSLAVFGILVIAVMNFGVSFILSLFVAARARNVPLSTFRRLARALGNRFQRSPRDFFYPARPKPVEKAKPAARDR